MYNKHNIILIIIRITFTTLDTDRVEPTDLFDFSDDARKEV